MTTMLLRLTFDEATLLLTLLEDHEGDDTLAAALYERIIAGTSELTS